MRCFVRVHGESFDPLKAENDFDTRLMRTLLDYEGGTPNWSYRNGCNITFFVTRKFVMVAVNMYCLQGEIVFQARDVE